LPDVTANELWAAIQVLETRIKALEDRPALVPKLVIARKALATAEHSAKTPKPWELEGISRSLYFARKRANKNATSAK
jgi:hypothetical protein